MWIIASYSEKVLRAETKTLTYFIVKLDLTPAASWDDVMTLFPACNNQQAKPDHRGPLQHPPTTTTNEVIWENLKWSLVPSSHAIHHLLVTSHQRWNDLSISSISRNNLIMHVVKDIGYRMLQFIFGALYAWPGPNAALCYNTGIRGSELSRSILPALSSG